MPTTTHTMSTSSSRGRCRTRRAPRPASRPLAAALSAVPLAVALACAPAAAQEASAAQTVVVSATRHAMPLADAPAAMSVINAEQLAARGADNLQQALRAEPGITSFGRTISGRRTVSLRGMDPRHTLVLVDGKRIAASDGVVGHSDFQLDWASMLDVERIEVVRGPMSVLYGAEALGGVVNIITRPLPERWSAAVLAEGSVADGDLGGDGHRAAASAAGALGGGLRLGVSAADSRRQTVTSSVDPAISAIEGRHKQDLTLRAALSPARGHELSLEQREGREERSAFSRERSGARRVYQSVTDVERSHGALGWSADWAGAWQAQTLLRAYRSRIELRNERSNGVAALRPQTLTDDVLEGSAQVSPWRGHAVSAGFEWRDEALDNPGLADGGRDVRHRALYLQDELALGPVALTAGLRHDDHGLFGGEWSPRLYAVARLAPNWVLKGGVGHGFKAPTLKQIAPEYQEDEGPNTFLSNPALRPETNDAAELGVAWDTAEWGASAMVFHNRVRDLVVPRLIERQGPRGLYVFENVDHAKLQGLETALSWRRGDWTVNAHYTYLDARDGHGARLEKRPRHTLGLRLDWRAGPWRAGLVAEHHRDQLLASLTPGQPPQPVPDLTWLGLHAGVELGRGLELRAGLDNATDLRLSDRSPLFTYAEPPRTLRLALHGRW